ncbi:MAG: acetyl-CoA C-acyltransferase [Candidatus Marinimicrobia bacterium]|nr:acetyl-CoA C-acyltransferase [Candidatus Neomarinimicrobiota bacterium]|tara:strand:+ start:278 stop:1408 length:1131 start_codon:yes stop_codon:yes gene_type:complete
MNNSVIIDGGRSPIGLKNGKLIGMRADDLSSDVIKKLINRNNNIDKTLYEDLVLGCAFPEGSQGMLMSKGVAILSDLPITTAAKVVNRFCGSSMDAVHQVSQSINSGDITAGIAGGVEDMFQVPMGGFNPSFHPDLYEKDYYIGMGETAENLAKDLDISRGDQEEFSISSHKKALNAQSEGKFDNEIFEIEFNESKIKKDEGPRVPNLDKIKSLNPAFDEHGTITAATSSPISIGAAALIIMNESKAIDMGIKAKFRIKSRAVAGVDWTRMGSGPLPATEKALSNAGLSIDDIDLIELNEAFAAQSLYVIRKGGWNADKINVNGGAIALGHPLGCSGSRIIITLMNAMEQNNSNLGLATMCIGTGQGIATILERIA